MSDTVKITHQLELQGVKFDLTTQEVHEIYKVLKEIVLETHIIGMAGDQECQCAECIGYPHNN